jgi:ketosteroid isomerase-like protein
MPTPTPTNIEVVQSMYAAFARGDVSAVLSALDPAVEWSEAENFLYAKETPYVGHQEVLMNVFAPIAMEWDHMAVVPDQFVDGGDTIVVFGHYRGAYKATGARVDAQFAHVFQVHNGLVVRFQQFTDTFQFKEAVSGRRTAGAQ